MSPLSIDRDFGVDLDSDDRKVIARQVVRAKRKIKKAAPPAVDLEAAITNLTITDTIVGSSTLVVTLFDAEWNLTDSDFFDSDQDGRLDPIDLNYPEGSRFWWRLTQIGSTMTAGGSTLTLTFMERAAVHMMAHRGPLKASRGKKTRAEFLKMLTDDVKAGGGIKFRSKELHKTQGIAALPPEKKTAADKKADKDSGINPGEKITVQNWDGSDYTLTQGELENAEKVLAEAANHTTDKRVLLALLEACIVEAPFFRNPSSGDASSVGILQLLDIHGSVAFRRDIPKVVAMFLTEGFTGAGGAIAVAEANPDWDTGRIAQTVQGSAFPDRYQKVRPGAEAVLGSAGGGDGATSDSYRQQYNFQVGSAENPREDFWAAAQRLAEQVKWALFLDGQNLYFDSEKTLIRQKPVAIIRRDDPAVVSFSSNWDARNIATEVTVELICDPFEFRAGDVFKLENFGAASTGSTAKLPGRWLISDVDRDRFSLSSRFTLKQPERPAPEPAPELAQRQQDEAAGGSLDGGSIEGSPKEVIDTVVIPLAKENGVNITVASNDAANARHGPTASGGRSDHQGPAAQAWAADLGIGSDQAKGTKLAKALAARFGFDNGGVGSYTRVVRDGFSIQILWQVEGHFDHVHIGCQRVGGGGGGPQDLRAPDQR